MQKTSALYEELLASDHRMETRLAIGETGVLITKKGDRITFGSKTYERTARGSVIRLEGTADNPLRGLTIYGKTTQDGTPSPDNPVPLVSPGDSGVLNVYVGDQVIPISTPNGLPGIPVTSGGNYTDENGQQWICDEVDFSRGVYVQRISEQELDGVTPGKNLTGTDSFSSSGYNYAYTQANNGALKSRSKAMSNTFEYHSATNTVSQLCFRISSVISINLPDSLTGVLSTDSRSTRINKFNAYLNQVVTQNGENIKILYQLATPIETPLSESELAADAALHTNYPSTTIYNDGGADMVVGYSLNGEGPTGILVGAAGADGGYDESVLISMETDSRVFGEDSPTVGSCVSAEIDVEMLKPYGDIPKRARMVPYVRLTDGNRHSEWIQNGVFYIDTRTHKDDGSDIEKIVIHGYDDMLKAEQDYPASTLGWPAKDVDVVREIAEFIGVSIDERTFAIMNRDYTIQYPAGYSCRDTLGYIAAMYAGCFIMSPLGELRLVTIYGIPKETRYLIDKSGFAITFGGDRILV